MRTERNSIWKSIYALASSDRFSGLIMLGFALLGLLLANLPATAHMFEMVAEQHVSIPLLGLDMPIGHWAQEGLLTVFFLVVGLDLKQELTTGSLANPKAAMVPMLAAIGGMIVPPLIFVSTIALYCTVFTSHPGFAFDAAGGLQSFAQLSHGWAIPTATDIAFSLAVLAIFAKGLPGSIHAFLMTLATVDDLLGIIVIALFFSHLNEWYWFVGVAVCAASWWFLVKQKKVPWILVGCIGLTAWFMMYQAGIHATLAGVLVGLLTPSREIHGERSPRAERYHHKLLPLSALLALPVFAFFATGIHFDSLNLAMFTSPVFVGLILALVIGKPLGVMIVSWISTRFLRLRLPQGLVLHDLLPAAVACGIGFTVSFLISSLAYKHPQLSAEARFAVLIGSLLSASIAGVLLNRQAKRLSQRATSAHTHIRDNDAIVATPITIAVEATVDNNDEERSQIHSTIPIVHKRSVESEKSSANVFTKGMRILKKNARKIRIPLQARNAQKDHSHRTQSKNTGTPTVKKSHHRNPRS